MVDGRHLYFDRERSPAAAIASDDPVRIIYRLEPNEVPAIKATVRAIAGRASQRAHRLAERRWPRAA
jgi:hypothetical protein